MIQNKKSLLKILKKHQELFYKKIQVQDVHILWLKSLQRLIHQKRNQLIKRRINQFQKIKHQIQIKEIKKLNQSLVLLNQWFQ